VLPPPRRVTPLGLVLHGLTKNAVKYGAWHDRGRVNVDWRVTAGTVHLTWREEGRTRTEEPSSKGFGSLLMTSAARQLGGAIEREFGPGTLTVTIRIPLD